MRISSSAESLATTFPTSWTLTSSNLNFWRLLKKSPEEVAMGFLSVANAAMTRPIRTLSEGRGYETAAHNLACFGGAGGQHATAVARDLGIKRVLIHRLSSILSAYGMALADVVVEVQEPESVAFG
jgi:5-oxoprolinase (ATP-hydrolysing)